MALLPVAEALERVLASAPGIVEAETIPLAQCHGRTLAQDVAARRTQPPFPVSAMDGYAVRAADVAQVPAELRVTGESAAGRGWRGAISEGEAVRIFTGAPLPEGADAIVIQEDCDRLDSDRIRVREGAPAGRYLRSAGLDFSEGDVLLRAGRRLDAGDIALAAAMNHAALSVRRKPRVAIIATGDELVLPGETPGPDQIVASNIFALAAMIEKAGGEAIDCGIARDTREDVTRVVAQAQAHRPDILLTLGGASVGDHDLVQATLKDLGLELGFWRIAMRPGKPLMHGRLGATLFLGLPGNPVSAMVCAILFVAPAIRSLLGDPEAARGARTEPAILAVDLGENDRREDYLRSTLTIRPDALPLATPFTKQDSSMLGHLARADALVIRAPFAPPAKAGDLVTTIRLDAVF
ncbi:MAG: molybdopterin molybdenumtransferase MoeA [Salinarimonadaceae bacterium]|nr:MAG: molybdopterin molybdenumtransferase MoeA [Salinarimonadaceae bacterium]